MEKLIRIRGAAEHNLRRVDVDIPRDRFTVITGVSGSGKSSLAFDTIYAEGQRRFMESLSSYARQFLTQAAKPRVERIEGLGPTIAIEQRKASANPRSTVATVTEIYDYLRVLYARAGEPHCPSCGTAIERQSSTEVVDRMLRAGSDRFSILAPVVRGRKGEHRDLIQMARSQGFPRISVDGRTYLAEDEVPALDKKRKHSVSIVVDRIVLPGAERGRLAASVETALKLGKGLMVLEREGAEELVSTVFACPKCDFSFGEIEPRSFSFNSPFGACQACHGLGIEIEIAEDMLIPNPELSLDEGALSQAMKLTHFMWLDYPSRLNRVISAAGIPRDQPFRKLRKEHRELLLHGAEAAGAKGSFQGIIEELKEKFEKSESEATKARIHQFMGQHPCKECGGKRLRREMEAITIGGKSLPEFSALTVRAAGEFLNGLELDSGRRKIAAEPIKEILSRLSFMEQVGLHYLTLSRPAGTLSGGEAQRIRLASQIGSRLVGVIYVLDEPSIGLHQRDNHRLISSLMDLRDLGNTVIVVEHDEATIRAADFVVDVGPGAGEKGGNVVFAGPPQELFGCAQSLTARYLSGKKSIPVPTARRKGNGAEIRLSGATANNLKTVELRIPLGRFTAITGVSGSGKSSLVNQTLYPALMRRLHQSSLRPGPFRSLEGAERIDKVIAIDQSPIGRSSRSNPGTYVKVLDPVRNLFSSLPLAKMRGFGPGRFSFNVKGGRCDACEGQGMKVIEMHFMADVEVVCEVCGGKRYNPETLEVQYKGKSISDVLDLPVDEAFSFFKEHPSIIQGLRTLRDVGLGYIRLGQSSTTLSGGESQRIKLASELSRRDTGSTLYLLDEPTTGLHFEDILRLLEVLNRLVDAGNTVVVIEHNLDVIKVADHVVDLGPEGGAEGGRIVARGSPEELARSAESHTGRFLAEILAKAPLT